MRQARNAVRRRIREGQLVRIKGCPLGVLNVYEKIYARKDWESIFPISQNLGLFSPIEAREFDIKIGLTFKKVKRGIWIVLNQRGGHIWMLIREKDLDSEAGCCKIKKE